MAPLPFRSRTPTRSNVAPQYSYRLYKPDLRADFDTRCGYCDARDEYFGGVTGSHIDHFAPKSKFPDLETVYDNLVYSCPFCNRAKSNKWIGDNHTIPNDGQYGFVDPCSTDFDLHLARDSRGRVVSLTPLGEYMVKNLNMRLLRHQFIWQAQRLDHLAAKLQKMLPMLKDSHQLYVQVLEMIAQLFAEYRAYCRRASNA